MNEISIDTKMRFVAILLTAAVLCASLFGMPRVATAGAVTEISASYSGGVVSVTGSVSEGTHAVAVLVYSGSTLLRMETAGVETDWTFAKSIAMALSAGTYSVKAADYDGGEFSETTFTIAPATPPDDSSPGSDVPGGSTGGSATTPATQPVTRTETTVDGGVSTQIVTTTLTDVQGNQVTRVARTSTDAATGASSLGVTISTSGESTTIPSDIFEAAESADAASVAVETAEGTVAFDRDAVLGMAVQAGGEDLTVSLARRDESSLPDQVREAAGQGVVYELSIQSASEEIVEFDGAVTVSIAVPDDFEGQNVYLYHIAADGTPVLVEGVVVLRNGVRYFEFTTDHFSYYALQPVDTLPFVDVDEDDWWFDSIYYVCARGLFQGTSRSTFAPQGTMTRAMLVTVLHRLEGAPEASAISPLTDVQAGQWYTAAVNWAGANGIVEGYPDGRFGVGDDVTRQQMAVILYRYANYKGYSVSAASNLGGYSDAAEIDAWACDAMTWANAKGIIAGTTPTTLAPRGNASRAQVAAVLMRFAENANK
jgi:hypothetical protein